jgi:putative ABC transport system permease protein
MARRVPLSPNGGGAEREVDIRGERTADGHLPQVHYNSVAPNYFSVMGTRLLRGAGFPAEVTAASPKMVVINDAMARQYWPDGSALGQTIGVTGSDGGAFEVVGIAEDGKYMNLTEAAAPYMFFALDQMPSGEVTLVARTAGRAGAVTPAVRATLARLDSRMPTLGNIITLDEHLSVARYESRLLATTATSLGAAGLALSLTGLYAVIAFVVARRRREIGVRMALGAEPRDVVVDVLKQTGLVAGCGMAVGVVLAAIATGGLATSLVGLSPFDPATYVGALVVVSAASGLAVWQPARRAARVDPAVTLRE